MSYRVHVMSRRGTLSGDPVTCPDLDRARTELLGELLGTSEALGADLTEAEVGRALEAARGAQPGARINLGGYVHLLGEEARPHA